MRLLRVEGLLSTEVMQKCAERLLVLPNQPGLLRAQRVLNLFDRLGPNIDSKPLAQVVDTAFVHMASLRNHSEYGRYSQ